MNNDNRAVVVVVGATSSEHGGSALPPDPNREAVRRILGAGADDLLALPSATPERLAWIAREAPTKDKPGGWARRALVESWEPPAAPARAATSIDAEKRTLGVEDSEKKLQTLEKDAAAIAAKNAETEAFLAQFTDAELEVVRRGIAIEYQEPSRTRLLEQKLRSGRVSQMIADRMREHAQREEVTACAR